MKVAVIGAGLMGHGIAQVFAASGHPVDLVDLNAEVLASAKDRIQANLTRLAEYGLADGKTISETLARVTLAPDHTAACAEADIVFEAATEDLDLKQRLFAEIDRVSSEKAILCSCTSVMSITEIGAKARRRERILGTHFWNPPYLIPLVEVIRTEHTAARCMAEVYDLLEAVGKRPVRVEKDVPGFVGNRLQHALWREAFALVDEGICDAATVDMVVRNSFGLRLPVLGPVANADMVGLDLTLAIHDYILKHLNASPIPSTTLRAKVAEGQLGFKTKRGFLEWTDREMAVAREQLVTHLLETLSRRRS